MTTIPQISRTLRSAALLTLAIITAHAQSIDPAAIKARVDEAMKSRQAANEAYAKGNAEEGKKQSDLALDTLRKARDDFEAQKAGESNDPAVLLAYSSLLNETGDYDLSELALLRAVRLEPDDANLWLKLGQTQAALGPKSESNAILSLRKASSFEPATKATTEAYASLGALYQQAGLYEFARETYAKALELDPSHLGTKLAVAALDAREGNMVKAEEAFDSIENLSPENGPYIKRTLGPALDEFAQSRRWLEDTAPMHLAYAELLIRVGRIDESFLPLNRSLRLDDQNYIAWNLMGSVMRGLNRLRGSREAFMRSLELNPDQPRTRDALAELDAIEAQNPGSTTVSGATPATTPTEPSAATPPPAEPSPTPAPAEPASAPPQGDAAATPAPSAAPPAAPVTPAPAP